MAANPVTKNGLFVHNNTVAPEHPSLMSMFSLKGKTAIVTGAGAGIGLAVAQGLAEAGANVALWYRSNTKCPERAAEIAQQYGVQSTQRFEYMRFPSLTNSRLYYSQGLPGRSYRREGRRESSE